MQSETAGNGVEGKELDEDYQSSLDRFTDAVEKAIVSSHAGTGLDAGERRSGARSSLRGSAQFPSAFYDSVPAAR